MKKIFRPTQIGAFALGITLLLVACNLRPAPASTSSDADARPTTTPTPATTAFVTIPIPTDSLPLTGEPAVPDTYPDAVYSWDPYCFDRLIGAYEADTRLLVDAILNYQPSVELSLEHARTVVDNIAFEFPPSALADFSVLDGMVTITYLHSEEEHARQLIAFESAVNRALSILSAEDGEARRATLLYNWVVENVSYFTTDYTDKEITAFSALTAGETICYGFADAFGYLLRQTGMEAHLWRGGTYTFNGFSDHGWCYAKVDGDYYHFDPTWERSNYKSTGVNRYTYFGMTDQKRFTSLSKSCVSGFGALEAVCDVTKADHKLDKE